MKTVRLVALLALSGLVFASCATGPSNRSFGPYSDAEAFYKKGDYSKAVEKYQEYLAANPQGNLAAIAEYYIAKSYIASGDTAKAREGFERVARKFPGTSWAEFAKEQLAALHSAAEA